MVEDDIAVHRLGRSAGLILLARGVQHLRDAGDRYTHLAHLRDHAAKTADRRDAHRVIDGEGHELALCHLAAHAQKTSQHHDEHGLDAGRGVADGPEVRKRPAEPDPEGGIVLVLRFKALPLIFLPAEGAHDAHAGQILLRDGRQHALRLVAGGEALADGVMEQQRIDDDHRKQNCRDQRQLPVHQRHAHEREYDHGEHPEDGDELLFKEGLDALDVRRAALDDIARGVFHVPFPRQVLDVVVQKIPARLDERLARLGAVEVHAVAHQGRQQTEAGHHGRRDPQILPEVVHPAQRLHDGPGRRDLHRAGPDQRVHAHADDLRDDELKRRKEQARGDAGDKIPPAAVQQLPEHTPVRAVFRVFQEFSPRFLKTGQGRNWNAQFRPQKRLCVTRAQSGHSCRATPWPSRTRRAGRLRRTGFPARRFRAAS